MKAVVKITLLLVILAISLNVAVSQVTPQNGMMSNPFLFWSLINGNDRIRRFSLLHYFMSQQGQAGAGGFMNPLLLFGLAN